jgi:hypothetical protein
MTKLEKLQLEYTNYKWNYDRCNKFSKDRYYSKMQEAWENLKEYKLKNCPELLEQPKRNIKPIPFTPIDTWCEIFENYNF